MLRQRLPQLAEDDAGRVADAVDNLPLALTQAAVYLQETGLTAQAYLQQLTHRATSIMDHGVPATYGVSLAASLHLAFDQLIADEPAVMGLLRLAAQLAPEPIPFTLFTAHAHRLPSPLAAAAGDPVAFAGITGVVRRRALARVGPDSLQLHRLVQAILRDRPASTPDEDDTTTVAYRLLHDAVPADPWNNPASWPAWRQLLPHVLTITDTTRSTDSHSPDVPWLLDRAVRYLHTRGEPRPARALFERAHQLYRDMLGEDHPDTLASATNLAADLRELREHKRARELQEDTLTRYRRVLGDDHPDTLRSAHNLALDLRKLGEYGRAHNLDADTLRRYRRVLDDDHPATLRSAHNLAADLRALDDFEGARDLDTDTLTRYRRVLGDDHPDTLHSANNLAADLRALGDYGRARDLDTDTWRRYRRVLGDHHPDTLRSSHNLALDERTLRAPRWQTRDPYDHHRETPRSTTYLAGGEGGSEGG